MEKGIMPNIPDKDSKKMTKKKSKFELVILLFLLVILLIGLKNKYFINEKIDTSSNNKQSTNKNTCNRTEPYEMPPEFSRALSLIIQRLGEYPNNKSLSDEINKFKNCYYIQYSGNLDDAEGYFIFDYSKANANYLPIYANPRYMKMDDISTSILLMHEIIHARQFLYTLASGRDIDCYEKETNAFFDQYIFTTSLNLEEKKSLTARMNNYGIWTSDSPQVQITKQLLDLSYEADIYCGTNSYDDCWSNRFEQLIKNMILNNEYYQAQCGYSR